MSAVAWVPEKSAIVVMAEIPRSSSYGGIMCQVLGNSVPSGKILQRLTAKELKEKWPFSIFAIGGSVGGQTTRRT